MSEITSDLKISNMEITNSLGINLSNSSSRIKHTGSGLLSIKTISGKIILNNTSNTDSDSIKINSEYGGLYLNASSLISIQTSDTIYGVKIGTENSCPITIGTSSSNIYFEGSINIKGTSTTSGRLILDEATNNGLSQITIKAPNSLSSSYTLTLPDNDGSAGQFLQTDGSGTLTWASASAGLTIASASDTDINSPSTGQILKFDGSNWTNTKTISDLTMESDLTLNNTGNNVQYIYLNYNATSSNRWRIYVDNSSGNLIFERYNGSSWVSKLDLT